MSGSPVAALAPAPVASLKPRIGGVTPDGGPGEPWTEDPISIHYP